MSNHTPTSTWKKHPTCRLQMAFGDFILGAYVVEIVFVGGAFVGQVRTPSMSRFCTPTRVGTWGTEAEAKEHAPKAFLSMPWCPERFKGGAK